MTDVASRDEGRVYRVCEESPLRLYINGNVYATFMCTPADIADLVTGFLFSRGIIRKGSEILSLDCHDGYGEAYVTLARTDIAETFGLGGILSSGCGSGFGTALFTEEFLRTEPIETDMTMRLEDVRRLTKLMFATAELYRKTGGVHCAAVIRDNAICVLREDVGRHNAVDKAIGSMVRHGMDLSVCCISTSGRMSSDMVLKAYGAGIPIIASRSIPTTLALDIALHGGVTLIGRAADAVSVVYTHTKRVVQ